MKNHFKNQRKSLKEKTKKILKIAKTTYRLKYQKKEKIVNKNTNEKNHKFKDNKNLIFSEKSFILGRKLEIFFQKEVVIKKIKIGKIKK